MTNRQRAAAAAVALAFLILHLPFLPASLEDLDSFNFALGLLDFDVAEHRPHPPGYPVFILLAQATRGLGFSEVQALSLLGVAGGAAAVWALLALFRALEPTGQTPLSLAATTVAVTSPLFWLTAARPLSDMLGLSCALTIQATLLASSSARALAVGAFLAGLGVGVRSQVIHLTAPLLALVVARRFQRDRWHAVAIAAVGFSAGALLWAVPLLVVTGGPWQYWQALSQQSAEDLSGVSMLWTTPTVRQLIDELYFAFLAPWNHIALGFVVLALACVGLLRMFRHRWHALLSLGVAFGPYLAFTILFQEAVTTRYALPTVIPVAYLAVEGARAVGRRVPLVLAVSLALVNVALAQPLLVAYASQEAPALRLLQDMRARATGNDRGVRVLAMHRRTQLDLRRPIQWMDDEMPAFAERLPSPPKHEWLELVQYWNRGGREPVWFVADPLRSDLALIAGSRPAQRYRWPFKWFPLLGGVRPNEMDWHVIEPPQWYLGEGWSLTPETAGVAVEDGVAARGQLRGWIRRETVDTNLVLGGRNFGEAPARVGLAIDGRSIAELDVLPGFFVELVRIPAHQLAGPGDYGQLSVQVGTARIGLEQFDAQPTGRPVFGFGAGWHELEYDPATGRLWRWTSERADLVVRAEGQRLRLSLNGETDPSTSAPRASIRVGDRTIADVPLGRQFSYDWDIPSDLVAAPVSTITIETNEIHVPAEIGWRSADRRRLGLKVYECRLTTVS